MHCRLSSMIPSQLVIAGESSWNFLWEKSQWDNTVGENNRDFKTIALLWPRPNVVYSLFLKSLFSASCHHGATVCRLFIKLFLLIRESVDAVKMGSISTLHQSLLISCTVFEFLRETVAGCNTVIQLLHFLTSCSLVLLGRPPNCLQPRLKVALHYTRQSDFLTEVMPCLA